MPRLTSGAVVIDLNADLGEGVGTDDELLTVITSANIACGVHAGDAGTIRRTVAQARQRGVQIGAHPSFPDRDGFGRRPMTLPPDQVEAVVAEQVRVLAEAARQSGGALRHVKPHGALYNMAAADRQLARAIGRAVQQVDPAFIVVALAGAPIVEVLRAMGLRVAREAFIDRGYTPQGALVPRDQPGALVTGEDAAARRAVELARDGVARAVDGTAVAVEPDTLCIHGDSPAAVTLARRVRQALEDAGIAVRRMDSFLADER